MTILEFLTKQIEDLRTGDLRTGDCAGIWGEPQVKFFQVYRCTEHHGTWCWFTSLFQDEKVAIWRFSHIIIQSSGNSIGFSIERTCGSYWTDIISPLKNWEKVLKIKKLSTIHYLGTRPPSLGIRGSNLNLHECHWQIGRGEAVSDPSAGLNRPMECGRREARSHGWYLSSFMCKDKKWHGYLVCMCALPLFLENICNKHWTHKNATYNKKSPET